MANHVITPFYVEQGDFQRDASRSVKKGAQYSNSPDYDMTASPTSSPTSYSQEPISYCQEPISHSQEARRSFRKTNTQGPPSVSELETPRSEEMRIFRKGGNQGASNPPELDSSSLCRTESRPSIASVNFEDDSLYPEVRAAVSNIDDPSMPVNTFRMWFLGILFTIIVSALNQAFSMRYPSVFITGIVIQLVSFPLGHGLARLLPSRTFKTLGFAWSLNPGPFSIKEHVCIVVMASIVVNGAYATDVILTQKIFYHQRVPFIYQICLCLGTQIIGFSWAGFLRKYVVWPANIIWPSALVNAALFNTLHNTYHDKSNSYYTRRQRFFFIALACSFVWYWIPGFFFTALSAFNWACWIAPNNVVVNALFGTSSGLGMGILTFDWSMIAYMSNPLVTPWWCQANIACAFVLIFWIICPILYFTNAWNSAFFPVISMSTFDNTGARYNVSTVVTPDGFFDEASYREYSPVFMSIALVLSYGIGFASITAVLVHTFLWFGSTIIQKFDATLQDERDIHSRLMSRYDEVPWTWYGAVGLTSLFLTIIAVTCFPTQLPVWALFIGLIFGSILSLPAAYLKGITNQGLATQIFHEMLGGYILPGRPVANMIMKTVGYIGTGQAVTFAGDLKLGHYMKVPPRVMFMCQVVAATISVFVVVGVQEFILNNIEDVCTPHQPDRFVCPGSTVFANTSLIWGGVGPRRLFGRGAPYSGLMYGFLIGAVLPVPFYFLARRFPRGIWRDINIPVCLSGLEGILPGTGINIASWSAVGFIFNYVIRRRSFSWWARYNYILAAALDAGVVIASVVIFFAITYPFPHASISWWGNDFWQTTADALGTPWKIIGEQPIGPKSWS